jgi:alkylation response protein AidB-like acyl-CoA dehydrogenase
MNFDLTDEQTLIRDTARDFVEREVIPVASENSRKHHFDEELVGKLAQQGYLGAIVPPEYGGAGLSYLDYGLVVEEVGRGCASTRTVVSVQTSLVCSAILRWGSEEQKQKYLPLLCSGQWLGCFGLTEPDTGSDAANQRTRARRDGEDWIINGAKMWISLGCVAKLALIFAQTDPDKAHRGLACFLVETEGQDGFLPTPIHNKMGLWAADTAEIGLEGVRVPDNATLGSIGDGFKVAMGALDSGRFSVACGSVGVARGMTEASVKYATEREQFGRPIGAFQLVQEMLAEMALKTDAARLLAWRAGALKDAGKPNTTETSMAKLFATEAAVWCADRAIQIHGGAGYSGDFPLERHYRDARVTTLYEGTSQIQKMIIGRSLTGLDALTR